MLGEEKREALARLGWDWQAKRAPRPAAIPHDKVFPVSEEIEAVLVDVEDREGLGAELARIEPL